MPHCLYECLRAVGLQHHFDRFTSMGVRRAAHLSALTMDDYPTMGIHTMEDRMRLFHLIKMLDVFELESFGDGYDKVADCDDDDDDEDDLFACDGYSSLQEEAYSDKDEKDAATQLNTSDTSGVCKRLDFSFEDTAPYQNVFSVRNDVPVQDISMKHNHDSGNPAGYHSSHHLSGANSEPGITEQIPMCNYYIRLSPKSVPFYKPNSRVSTVTSKNFTNKPVGDKDRKAMSRKGICGVEKGRNKTFQHAAKPTPVYESKKTGYNYGLPLSSSSAPYKRRSRDQRISVCVRKRPLTLVESRKGEADVVTAQNGDCVIVHESKEAVDLTEYILQHKFYFDQVFGEGSSNEEVYQSTAFPLVQHTLNGGNATCFAYGQTGAGKTHTMLGSSPWRPGLYALAAQDIFAHLSTTQTPSSLLVYVSFFEIYCGQLYDLLDHRKRLFAREDGQKIVHIAGLSDIRVDSVNSLLEVISRGTDERTQGVSGVNPISSRSHALLQIQIRSPNQQTFGRMWFVDLAGSERASDTKEPNRQSRMEGAEINQSLLALKECIRSLDQSQSHTPFRQSKLTQVLKDSFVGDSKTCMIANISPGHLATEHTLNTLRYADRVKELRAQGGARGGRKGKRMPYPKHNQFKCNSSRCGVSNVGARRKSPPKKPKLGKQQQAFGPIAATLSTVDAILCSTPNTSRSTEGTVRERQGVGLQHITPIRGLLRKGDQENRKQQRNIRRQDKEKYGRSETSSVNDQNDQTVRAGLVIGQPTDEDLHSWKVPTEDVACAGNAPLCERETGEMEKWKSLFKVERDEGRRCREWRRQVESSAEAHAEGERAMMRASQMFEEKCKERDRHLRWYHQQLQQFVPSPSSSSKPHLPSSSVCPSLSSSVFPPPCSSLQHSPHLSVPPVLYRGLEEPLGVYRVSIEVRGDETRGQSSFPGGKISLQTEALLRYNIHEDEDVHGDAGAVGKDSVVPWEGTSERVVHDIPKNKGSLEASGKGETIFEDWRRNRRRWAWVETAEPKQNYMRASSRSIAREVQASCNFDLDQRWKQGLPPPIPSLGVWSTEEEGGACSIVSVSSQPLEGSPNQQAPAERPLSPGCESSSNLLNPHKANNTSLHFKHADCTANTLPPPLQNVGPVKGVSSNNTREEGPCFTPNTNRREVSNAKPSATSPTIPVTQDGCKISAESLKSSSENLAQLHVHSNLELRPKMSVLHQAEILSDSADSIMDSLSISLLQVDQEAATSSFIQGEQSITSLCLLEKETSEDYRTEVEEERLSYSEIMRNVVKDMDEEFSLSLLELPEAQNHRIPNSNIMAANNYPEPKKEMCLTHQLHEIDTMKSHLPAVMLLPLQDQQRSQAPETQQTSEVVDNKALDSPLKSPPTNSQTQPCGDNGSLRSNDPVTNCATQTPKHHAQNMHSTSTSSTLTPHSQSVLGQLNIVPNLCPSLCSKHSFSTVTGSSSQQITPIIHLSALEDLNYVQQRVVQAHWEQLQEMEDLCCKERRLLCQQPDMDFLEYVHKLEEIVDRKAWCVHSMRAQLQPYKLYPSNLHNRGENHDTNS